MASYPLLHPRNGQGSFKTHGVQWDGWLGCQPRTHTIVSGIVQFKDTHPRDPKTRFLASGVQWYSWVHGFMGAWVLGGAKCPPSERLMGPMRMMTCTTYVVHQIFISLFVMPARAHVPAQGCVCVGVCVSVCMGFMHQRVRE